jgi:hypothetical protein
MIRIAILDDYQNMSLEMADWSNRPERCVSNWPTSAPVANRRGDHYESDTAGEE